MLFLIFILLFKLFKNENIIITFLCSILIIYIIIAPRFCIEATLSGAKLFFYKVFPSFISFSNTYEYNNKLWWSTCIF